MSVVDDHWTGTRRRRHPRRRIRSGRPAGGRAPASSVAHRRRSGFRAPRRPMGRLFRAARRGLCRGRGAGRVKAAVDRRLFAGGGAPVRADGARRAGSAGRASPSGAGSPWRRLPRSRSMSRCPSSVRAGRSAAGEAGRLACRRRQRRALSRGLRRRTQRHRPVACVGRPCLRASDFELWVIEGQQAPVSLGVIPVGASARSAGQRRAARQDRFRATCLRSASSRPAVRRPAADRSGRGRRRPEERSRSVAVCEAVRLSRVGRLSQAFVIDFQRFSRSAINSARR